MITETSREGAGIHEEIESAMLVCDEDKKNPEECKWKWGEKELPIVDRYTYLAVEM